MSSYGIFDINTGQLIVAMQATELRQVQIQAPIGSGRVILEGNFTSGRWMLGEDGWPVELPVVRTITADQVKYVARKRLEATDWKVTRHRDQQASGEPTSLTEAEFEALHAERQAIRAASNAIEQMDPIPEDFWQDHYWSAP